MKNDEKHKNQRTEDSQSKSREKNLRYLADALERLYRITFRLKRLGPVVLWVTLLNLIILTAEVIAEITGQQHNGINSWALSWATTWLIADLMICSLAILVLRTTDISRREGEALFQEISNLNQILVTRPDAELYPEKDSTRVRLELRSFSLAADFPLIRGRYGAAVYAGVNITITLIAIVLYAQFS